MESRRSFSQERWKNHQVQGKSEDYGRNKETEETIDGYKGYHYGRIQSIIPFISQVVILKMGKANKDVHRSMENEQTVYCQSVRVMNLSRNPVQAKVR